MCGTRRVRLLILACLVPALVACGGAAQSRTGPDVETAQALTNHDLYVAGRLAPTLRPTARVRAHLRQQIRAAQIQGVHEKIGLVTHVPSHFSSMTAAARGLQDNYLGLKGLLVLVGPRGVGVASNELTDQQARSVAGRVAPVCTQGYADCALRAGDLALAGIQAGRRADKQQVTSVWLAGLAGVVVSLLALGAVQIRMRRRRASLARSRPADRDKRDRAASA